MATHKSRLIALLAIEAALVLVHVVLRSPVQANTSASFEWHFWAALLGAVALVGYALSIRCPVTDCHKLQVFRGMSFFDMRLPGERCYACGASLEQKPNAIEP